MKIARFSIELLKREKKSSILYVLSLILSTAAIHAIICIYQNPTYFSTGYDHNVGALIANYSVMVLSLCIIIMLAIYAHNYFLTNKYKMIGVIRLGGGNFKEVIVLILAQTFVLLIIALPIGLLLGTLIYSYINHLFVSNAGVQQSQILSVTSFVFSLVLLSVMIFYLAFTTLGFVYRHEITELLGYKKANDRSQDKEKVFNFSIPGIVYVFFILGSFYLIVSNIGASSDYAMVFGLAFLAFLMGGFIKKVVYPLISKIRRNVYITNKIVMVSLGFVNLSLVRVNALTRLLGGSILLTSGYLCMYIDSPNDFVYFYLLFLIFIVLTSFSLLYQILMESLTRKEAYKQLYTIGYTKKDLISIIRSEIVILMIIIGVIGYVYTAFAYINYVISGTMKLALAIQLSSIYLITLIILGLVAYRLYKKSVLKELN